jgi:hypothetical protein
LVTVEIRHIPVDTGRLKGFTCTVGPMPYTDRDSGEARTDRESGLPLFQVGVTVRLIDEREAEVWLIQVAGEPVGLVEDEKVTLHGLSVQYWSREGRSGLTYRASAITHANAPAPAAAVGPVPAAAAETGPGRAPGGRGAARE